MILYEELQRDIGRNLAKDEGLASFGINAKNKELVLPPNMQYFWA
jgi:hypothetical protein